MFFPLSLLSLLLALTALCFLSGLPTCVYSIVNLCVCVCTRERGDVCVRDGLWYGMCVCIGCVLVVYL